MKFEWDFVKNEENKSKHGISFEQVIPLFYQEHTLEFDAKHSTHNQERWILRGCLNGVGPVMVVHTEEIDDEIRIISARKEE